MLRVVSILLAAAPSSSSEPPCTHFSGWYSSGSGEEMLVFDRNGRYLDVFRRRGKSEPLTELKTRELDDRSGTELDAGDVRLSFRSGCQQVTVSSGLTLERLPVYDGGTPVRGKALGAERLSFSGWYRDPRSREEVLVFDCASEPLRSCTPSVFYRRNDKSSFTGLGITLFDVSGDQPFLDVFFPRKPAESYRLAFVGGRPAVDGTTWFLEGNPLMCRNPDGSVQRFERLGERGVFDRTRTNDDPCLPITSRFPGDLPKSFRVGLDLPAEVPGRMSSLRGDRYTCELVLLPGGKAKGEDCALSWVLGDNDIHTGAWRWSRSSNELRINVALTETEYTGKTRAAGSMSMSFKAARMAPERVVVSVSGMPPNGSAWPEGENVLEGCTCAVRELCVSAP